MPDPSVSRSSRNQNSHEPLVDESDDLEQGIAEALYSHVYRLSPAIFTISSPKDGRYIDVNRSWTSVTDYTREEAQRKTVVELGLWANPEDRTKFVEKIRTEGLVHGFEATYRRKDGGERHMLLSGEIIEYRGSDCLLVVGQDITERVELERMKADFVTTVSHELRTLLTSIKDSLGLLRGDVIGNLPEKLRSMVDIAYRNCDRLVALVDDILDIEKIEAGKMEFQMETLDLADAIAQALQANKSYAEQYDVELRLQSPATQLQVGGDAQRLQQVLANLISNAAKFSPTGSVVDIALTSEGNIARLSVTDHGAGRRISRQDISEIRAGRLDGFPEKGRVWIGAQHHQGDCREAWRPDRVRIGRRSWHHLQCLLAVARGCSAPR